VTQRKIPRENQDNEIDAILNRRLKGREEYKTIYENTKAKTKRIKLQ
jgi:hypothetical protein